MKNNHYFSIMATVVVLFFFSIGCNTNTPNKEPETKQAVTKAVEAVVPPVFVPFKVMSVTHTVKNFDVWKKSYDEHESMRLASGLTKLAVCRDMDSPNKVYVFVKMADVQKAKDFAANPDLKQAMQKGGVNSVPSFLYVDVVRFEESPTTNRGRVRVGHKVKDFESWLKVYDAEGKETRAKNGLIDRAISRDLTDPNMVYITFAISDLAKVKARLKDPSLKKIMTEAGVISEPVINFYTSVD
jgi:quinol monooxygenase YgiN